MHRTLISRRRVIQDWAALAASAGLPARAQGIKLGKPGTASGDLPVHLIKEMEHASLVDVSADSESLCLYFSRHPARSFTWNGSWKENRPLGKDEDALRVVGRGSGVSRYETRLPSAPNAGSFFADGERLYVETQPVLGSSTATTECILIDLRTGKQQERAEPLGTDAIHFSYRALAGDELLGIGSNLHTAKTELLMKVKLPDFREVKRVPFAESRSASLGRTEGPIVVSADHSTLVCSYDKNVVCRRTEDLGILWTQKTDPALTLWTATISADAGLVAAYVCDYTGIGQARTRYVAVFDGKDGSEITRVSVDALESLAVSPDRKLLAAGQRVPLRATKAGTQPTVLLFDIASGKQVATLIQDQFYGGGSEFLYAGVRSMFTPDGKFLITSGLNTRIWQIG